MPIYLHDKQSAKQCSSGNRGNRWCSPADSFRIRDVSRRPDREFSRSAYACRFSLWHRPKRVYRPQRWCQLRRRAESGWYRNQVCGGALRGRVRDDKSDRWAVHPVLIADRVGWIRICLHRPHKHFRQNRRIRTNPHAQSYSGGHDRLDHESSVCHGSGDDSLHRHLSSVGADGSHRETDGSGSGKPSGSVGFGNLRESQRFGRELLRRCVDRKL
jgi:hypothetical protein